MQLVSLLVNVVYLSRSHSEYLPKHRLTLLWLFTVFRLP